MATGHVRKRETKDGKVRYQIIVEHDRDPITGERRREYETVEGTKRQAEKRLSEMLCAIQTGGITKQATMSVEGWLTQWMDLYLTDIAETTKAGYIESCDSRLYPYLGKVQINLLQTSQVQRWINDLNKKKGLAPKTIRNVFNILNAAMKKAVVLQMIQRNPCDGVVLPKGVPAVRNVYSPAQINAVLQATKGTDVHIIAVLGLTVGLRRGELAALRWEDVDFENGIIHVRTNRVVAAGKVYEKNPKSKAGKRDLYVHSDTLNVLKEEYAKYLADKEEQGAAFKNSGRVIRKSDGSAYNPDSILQKWERYAKRNNLPYIPLHAMRHTCATTMNAAGVNAKVLQEYIGHSDFNLTYNVYTHVLPEQNKEAVEMLEKIVKF